MHFHSGKCVWKCRLWNGSHVVRPQCVKSTLFQSIALCHPEMFQKVVKNALRLRQNGQNFVDDNFKYIFSNENLWITNTISLKYVPQSTSQYVGTGYDNGLVLNGWQSLIWSNDDTVHWCTYASSGLNELSNNEPIDWRNTDIISQSIWSSNTW